MTAPTIPALKGFDTFYGVPVSYLGDDGDAVALGHHDVRTTVAAFNRLARSCGLTNMLDDKGTAYLGVALRVSAGWAVLADGCTEVDSRKHSPACGECQEIAEAGWAFDVAAQGDEGAFPVMWWSA